VSVEERGHPAWQVLGGSNRQEYGEGVGVSGALSWGPRTPDSEGGGRAGAADPAADAGHGASSEAERDSEW
jgi:hypothetical protein